MLCLLRSDEEGGAQGVADAGASEWTADGRTIAVSHLEKVYWPGDGLTKGDLLHYYQTVAPVLLPHCADRPATLRVYPNGVRGFSYYRRELPDHAPDWLRGIKYRPETTGEPIRLPLIDDAAGLVWLANTGAIEFHLWASRLPDLAAPDQAIFDLDPGDQASFGDALRAALCLRDELERLGLHGYPKTSGGVGLHVYLPLAAGHSYDAVRAWVKAVAERLATAHPDLIAVARGATHRGGQVTVDYAQNSVGRNTAAPYTLRARPGAPVSCPLTWDEVGAGRIAPSDLTLRTVPDRVTKLGDVFAAVLTGGQRLPAD